MAGSASTFPSFLPAASSLEAVTARLQLVNDYNRLASVPDAAMTELQRAFVYGRMMEQDTASFIECYAQLIAGLAGGGRS